VEPSTAYRIVAKHSGKVLDVADRSQLAGAHVNQFLWLGQHNQGWFAISIGNGYYKIVALHSGMVLEVEGQAKGNSAAINQADWKGRDHQMWRLEDAGDGYYIIQAKHSGRVIDIAGGTSATKDGVRAQQYDYNGDDNQRFRFEPFNS